MKADVFLLLIIRRDFFFLRSVVNSGKFKLVFKWKVKLKLATRVILVKMSL